MRIRDGDHVGEHVTEEEPRHGESERWESTEPRLLTHAATLLLQELA
jgi:hypothetical protein